MLQCCVEFTHETASTTGVQIVATIPNYPGNVDRGHRGHFSEATLKERGSGCKRGGTLSPEVTAQRF